jgi:adenylate kinase
MRYIFLSVIFFCSVLFGVQQHIVLVGPPGAGKGTLASFLQERYGYYNIACGDILREHVKNGTEFGNLVKTYISQGDPVPAQIALDALIKPEVESALSMNKPFIVDGFILSVEHRDALLDYFKQQNILDTVYIIQLDASDESIIDRVMSRVVCTTCHKNFTQQDRSCDICGGPLVARDDQKIIVQRLSKYHANIEPVVATLPALCKVIRIDTELPLAQLEQEYQTILLHSGVL